MILDGEKQADSQPGHERKDNKENKNCKQDAADDQRDSLLFRVEEPVSALYVNAQRIFLVLTRNGIPCAGVKDPSPNR